MGFLGRFLGGGRSNAYSEGMALLEEERFVEAADRFRSALNGRSDSNSDSLASFHFRQALVSEGRRLLRAKKGHQAIPFFSEAVELWSMYPDLYCMLGTAQGTAGDWSSALQAAKGALRLNPDYVEARLLEGVALQLLDRRQEAAQSLGNLVEVGRRTDHWLINSLGEKGDFNPDDLPANLEALLEQAVSGQSEKEEVAAAVAQCRAGNWEEGLVLFETLVKKRPRYPDYRTRHAAAFFQLGKNEEALAEVNAALALNDTYRTAIDLKGLILADSNQIMEACDFLKEADARTGFGNSEDAQSDLFGAFLRGVLALLTGDLERVGFIFEDFPDLVRDFSRAELLLAAADDLQDRSSLCGRRLSALVTEWPGESDYFFLLACHQLQIHRYQDVSDTMGRWPAAKGNDSRPVFLEDVLAFAQGRCPEVARPQDDDERILTPAWDFLAAKEAFARRDYPGCLEICSRLSKNDLHTEQMLDLITRSSWHYERDFSSTDGVLKDSIFCSDLCPDPVLPDSCLPSTIFLDYCRRNEGDACSRLEKYCSIHPEVLVGYWLSPNFWLDPIRTWIG